MLAMMNIELLLNTPTQADRGGGEEKDSLNNALEVPPSNRLIARITSLISYKSRDISKVQKSIRIQPVRHSRDHGISPDSYSS